MRAKKSLGQHFLMHARTAERIADAAGITPTDTVLEVGPGTGLLTRALLARAGQVVAIEKDDELIPTLQETFAKELAEGRLTLIHGDIRTADLSTLPERYRVVANIPYYITGEILRYFLSHSHKPTSMTLLVQKEVAERIARSKKESLLSLSVKVYGTPKYEFTVPKGAFVPAPSVDSAVLSIRDIRQDIFVSSKEEERFFAVLHAGFAHKRKLLSGNLGVLAEKAVVSSALQDAGIPERSRAEDITLSSWQDLARHLS